MRIIFLGTPDFAVASLDILVRNEYNVVAVITAPDKYGGRGRKTLIESSVKKYATKNNIPVLQPTNLKNPQFVEKLQSYNADLQIVVAFRMLPEVVWNMPRYGTYNLHGSLLPKYRGAAPIHWAVINGESQTGVTSFKLKHKIDTGDLLYQEKMNIQLSDTTGDVHDKMMVLGAETILKTVQAIEKNELSLIQQEESQVTKAPKLNAENTLLDFSQSSKQIYNKIRGLNPFPVAWTGFRGKKLKIYWANYTVFPHNHEHGYLESDGKSYFRIYCNDGFISLLDVQYEGKKRMYIEDFLRGIKI